MQSANSQSNDRAHTLGFYCSSTSWGGLEMNSVRYALWMMERGWKVKMFCVADSPIHKQALADTIPVVIIQRNRKYFDWPNSFRVKNLFLENSIDLCWFRDSRDFAILGNVKRLMGGKLKLIYQQAMQFGVSKQDIFHTLRFRPIDAWISTLNFLAEQVKSSTRFPHSRIHVIPLGVDPKRLRVDAVDQRAAREKLGLPINEKIFGIIGRIDPLKGQHVAVRALHWLKAMGGSAHLLILGENTLNEGDEYEKRIHALVEKFQLAPFVHFRPYDKDVSHFFHAIDVFTLCSKGETFGTVTIEAMACGIPVVATDSSGTPEILDHGKYGVLFDPDNAEMLAEKIHAIFTNKEYAEELRQKSLERFNDEYSKSSSIQRMENVVVSLLKKMK